MMDYLEREEVADFEGRSLWLALSKFTRWLFSRKSDGVYGVEFLVSAIILMP